MKINTTIFYITNNGFILAQRLKELYPHAEIIKFSAEKAQGEWNKSKCLIFIMASGIVVRAIAPLIKDKRTDPAVIVLDEKGKHIISLLSGHLGGANKITKEIAYFLGGQAVITTASDVNNLPSIDMWAKGNDLVIENWDAVPEISTRFLNSGALRVYIDQNTEHGAQNTDIRLPEEFLQITDLVMADIIITNKATPNPQPPTPCLYLHPKNLILGIGCNSGTSAEEIEEVVRKVLRKNNLSFLSVCSIATIDLKANEAGLLRFADKYGFKINTFTANELNTVEGIEKSEAVFKATGAYGVAEPAAILASDKGELAVAKQKDGNVTVAVAVKEILGLGVRGWGLERSKSKLNPIPNPQSLIPKLYIVGTGPGGIEHITPYAQKAIRESDVIVGYGTYLDLIKDLISDKEVVSTGMTQEVDRCRKAVELAMSGKVVSIISGGDPGIYAMAGLVFEILKGSNKPIVTSNKFKDNNNSKDSSLVTRHLLLSVEVIPGISALNACAARLGAPLMHDFASISLSDRLTPWELIEKRLEAAAMADFVIVLYNPKSMGRQQHINKARDIILKYRSPETPVGIVKGAMRENESVVVTNLNDMLNHDIDMQTTVIIGNSNTSLYQGRMITPRGYENKIQ
ncbi:MAG: cobalamin biosynthesis protein [Nitrospirae bacterium]|nr:cobalamin biosynthesis protein [Nitrospirota bacterium]